MLNDVPDIKTLQRPYRGLGTGAFLPMPITDMVKHIRAAIDAVVQAIEDQIPGVAGPHLERPQLSVTRMGAHDATLIRPMDAADLRLLAEAADKLPDLLVTLAPASAQPVGCGGSKHHLNPLNSLQSDGAL